MCADICEVFVIDAVRNAFGRAGEKGIFWNTRAEDLSVPLIKALIDRNPTVKPQMIEDSIYGLTTMCVGRQQGYSIIWENLVTN